MICSSLNLLFLMSAILLGWRTPSTSGWYGGKGAGQNSDGGWNFTPLDADRTAFLFNLTQGLKFDQRKDAGTTDRGAYQTANEASFGPTFGGGYDLYVNHELVYGISSMYSYGGDADFGLDLALHPGPYAGALQFGQIEVFTISAVPEPESWALMLTGLGLLGFAARRREPKSGPC